MKTLKIKEEIHKNLKDHCNKKGFKMNILAENIIIEYLQKEQIRNDNK